LGKVNKSIKDMTDDEIENEIPIYTNIEFTIKDTKFILKNINILDFKNYDNIKIIKLFLVNINWYQVLIYDKICILQNYFLLTERTKSKVVLVKETQKEYFFNSDGN
jgi:hypothetical protein